MRTNLKLIIGLDISMRTIQNHGPHQEIDLDGVGLITDRNIHNNVPFDCLSEWWFDAVSATAVQSLA